MHCFTLFFMNVVRKLMNFNSMKSLNFHYARFCYNNSAIMAFSPDAIDESLKLQNTWKFQTVHTDSDAFGRPTSQNSDNPSCQERAPQSFKLLASATAFIMNTMYTGIRHLLPILVKQVLKVFQ